MKTIKPNSQDQTILGTSIFLAGSIEMGKAEDWQKTIENTFVGIEDITLLNPRRDDWDSSWEQKESNPEFNKQVNWEMNMLERANIIFMYFSPETKSPISLLELGMHARENKMIVCCPEGFWRKGNVDIVCIRNGISLYDNMEKAIGALRSKISQHANYKQLW
jgi:hypothetical protein